MGHRKIIQGYVEQDFDEEGNCIGQHFFESGEAVMREGACGGDNGEEVVGEEIVDPKEIHRLEDLEKPWPLEMTQFTKFEKRE